MAGHGLLIHSPFEEHIFCEAASSTCIQGWSFLFNEFGILFWTNFSYLVGTLFGIPEIYFNVKAIPEYILYILRIIQDKSYDFRKCPLHVCVVSKNQFKTRPYRPERMGICGEVGIPFHRPKSRMWGSQSCCREAERRRRSAHHGSMAFKAKPSRGTRSRVGKEASQMP